LPLPPTDRQTLIGALADLAAQWRPMPEWANWQPNGSQRYAFFFEGKRYPPKKIIALATGVPVTEFSGGGEANEYLAGC
jgi:5-methylcytosine-specific restriction enzyme A